MYNIPIERTTQPKPRPSEDNLGFGRSFSDHMFVVNYSAPSGWQSPRVIPYQNIELDPAAAVLHYGQAIFEGMKAFYGVDNKIRFFRPEKNWQRMGASAERLCMQFFDQNLFLQGIEQLVRADLSWVPRQSGTSLYLRPTLIATEGFLGVRPSLEYLYYVIASPVGAYYSASAQSLLEPIKIWVERKYSRAAMGGIGAAKAGGNYASSLAAAVTATRQGFSQVLWLDSAQKKFVEEVGTMNVFFAMNDRVITPNLSGTILPGVTRTSVIELLRHWGYCVEERPIELAEVIAAQKSGELKEMFGTGTAASISPVGSLGLDDQLLQIQDGKVGELSRRLYAYLTGVQYGRVEDELGWTRILGPLEETHSELSRRSLLQNPTL